MVLTTFSMMERAAAEATSGILAAGLACFTDFIIGALRANNQGHHSEADCQSQHFLSRWICEQRKVNDQSVDPLGPSYRSVSTAENKNQFNLIKTP